MNTLNMNSTEEKNDYWATYWNSNSIIFNDNLHAQVGRTINKVPIDHQKWQFSLNEIRKTLNLHSSDNLLDLCAGNGLITVPLSLKCKSTTAVDISKTLLEKIDVKTYSSIKLIVGDIRRVNIPSDIFTKGLMYGALQYFSEYEAISVLETIFRSMAPGGVFLIGDIPDIDHLFTFYNKPEWVTAYFDSVKANTPAVGTWFKKDILLKMANYIGFSEAVILTQHPNLINSHYRFDLLITK
jgi:ubiquinone/menaquinone biosynthesis C-methylase UbiE